MRILIADKFEQNGIDKLEHLGCSVAFDPGLKGTALIDALQQSGTDVLVVRSTRVTREMLAVAKPLRMVIRAGSGYDTIDVGAAAERGIRVCNCPGLNAVAVAELTIGLMVSLDRRIVDATVDLRRRVWNKKGYGNGRGLKGRTLGIVGLGRVGYEVGRRAAAFDMNLLYTDAIKHKELEERLGIRKVPLDELLSASDFITLHVPGGAETRHMIGAEQLARMKPTAFLLNCSRGGVVDEQALAAAVDAGTVGGAGLDVFEIEPAATDQTFNDPIVDHPKIYGTHHIGASTEQAQSAVAAEVVRIVRAFQDSGEFLHCVNAGPAAATT